MEDIIIRQEEKLNVLIEKIYQVEEMIKKKNKNLKEYENYSIQLVNMVKEQKHQINQLKMNNRNINNYNHNNLFSNYNTFRKRNLKNDNEKFNLNFQSLDVNNDINRENISLPLINSFSYNNNNNNNIEKEKSKIEKKESENNEKNIEEFKNMMDQLMDDIEN